ncbi:MAG: VWA domain-containing protein, partial [Desulfatitalea sp.]
MKFARVEMLFLIWVVPLLLLAYFYGWRKRRIILERFADRRALAGLVPPGIQGRRRLRAAMVLAASLLLVVALAGPQYGFQWQTVERHGVDLIIALDCSRSMLAQDIQPTRLDRAKREIIDLLAMLQGDRVGLVAFSGTAFLQCPLTTDYSAFDLFLNVLTPDYLPMGGTDLSAALQTALAASNPKSTADKAIILITDGENTGRGDPEEAAQAAQKAGVKLFCIGVGSAEGVPVPMAGGGFQKGPDGQIVMTRMDEPLLTRMAVTTGGTYVRSVAGDMDLDVIYREHIRGEMAGATVESGRRQVWADRYQWPLALAIALLMAALAIPPVKQPLAAIV